MKEAPLGANLTGANGGREEVTLSRDLDMFTITMIGVGGMIGAGIFVLTGIAAGVAGPALILAFLLNGLVTSLTAMSYAELGSALPGAGGGYSWVKQALGGTLGFLSGWMSWFAQIVAGSLYALAFGRFAAELVADAGIPLFGLEVSNLTSIFMSLVIIAFTLINYLGAAETAKVGNILTMTKIFILALLVLFGGMAMARSEIWVERFTTNFLDQGFLSIFVAMGLTFIAYEGYEIIAQSGEEVVNPKRNSPRAIFVSIAIAVTIYVLVGFVAIGATVPPAGSTAWDYLGSMGEVAVIEVAEQTFPWGVGGLILLISGLISTTSALNAITYSSSRLSFAMGRDSNLPRIFSKIDPRRHTPSWAVIVSGSLMVVVAWVLPIEDVAAATSMMFLLLFLMVNIAAIVLRRTQPDIDRGYKIPFYPIPTILAILTNAYLAVQLFQFSAKAWYFGIIWVVIGLFAYFMYFSEKEAMEKPKEILLEEVLVSRDFSVLVPVANKQHSRILGFIGSILAKANQGEVLALNVVQVPPQLTLGEGRLFLKEGRAVLDKAITQAKELDVPVHTIIRLGRNVASAVRQTALENASNLIVLGWPGYTRSTGKLFGSVIDPIVDNPPTDVIVVRYRERRPLKKIMVPFSGALNSRKALKYAVDMAKNCIAAPAQITLLHVLPPIPRNAERIRAEDAIREVLRDMDYDHIETVFAESDELVGTILEQSEGHDLIVLGATEEPIFKNLLVGTMPERIARNAKVTVMMVKRRSSPLHSFVRQAILDPTVPKPLE
jgi:amino acid transporter/nucleotide-binding universal stress UspA family protein